MAGQCEKKALERYFLNKVRATIAGFPTREPVDAERPDFLFAESALGVEVTRIFMSGTVHQPSPAQFEAEAQKIVDKARAMAEANGMRPTLVDVYFDGKQALRGKDRETTAARITSIVEDLEFPVDAWQRVERSRDERLSPHLIALSARRYDWVTVHLWQVAGAGIVHEDFQAELQREIDTKNQNLTEYLTRCEKCWLVIVADWRGPSGFFEFSESMQAATYNFDFDRVFFLEAFSGKTYELRRAVGGT